MRVVMFRGKAVRRQQKMGDDKILVTFYNHPSVIVSPVEWDKGKANKYTDGTVPRKMVVRSL